jgi:hypothetical protein
MKPGPLEMSIYASRITNYFREALLTKPIVLLVAVSNTDPMPILSAPFLIPEKNVSHPRPRMARKTTKTIIHVISSMGD